MAKKSPAKLLKEKGLIPKHWDLRKPLTPGQKSYLTKQTRKYAQLVRRPGDFAIRTVSASTAKKLKGSGYLTEGRKAIIPNNGGTVRIDKGDLVYRKPGQTERVILKAGPDFLKRLNALGKKPLKPNQAYALKIGNSPTLAVVRPSLKELMQYASRINFHSADGKNYVSLVLVTMNRDSLVDQSTDEDDEDDESEDDGEE